MMTRTLGALLSLAALAAPAFAGMCKSETLMPEFFAFEHATRALPPQARADRFMSEIAARHPEFYTSELGDVRNAALRLLDPAHPEQMDGFPPLTDEKLRAVDAAMSGAFETAQRRFVEKFSDFRCETTVAFGPSFLLFDGSGARAPDGRWHMRFGVDTIAILHGPDDMPAFLAHELFHVYHHDLLGPAFPKDESLVWWQMWEEGLATYVSKRLTPGVSEQQVFWLPTDIVQRMKAPGAMRVAARLMLADFEKSGPPAWFQLRHSAPGLPPRAGYYVGYRMAAELGRTHSLTALARMSPEEVKTRARAFLMAQAR